MNKKTLSFESKKKLTGFLFVLPWIIGAITFSVRPIISSIIYSLSEVSITVAGLRIDFTGLTNYKYLFNEDPNFTRNLVSAIGQTIYKVPLVLVFSLFIALLLNTSFKGRLFFRGTFFLPIIIASGYVISVINGEANAAMLSTSISSDSSGATAMMTIDAVKIVLMQFGISEEILTTILGLVSEIFNMVWYSGIQILLFLASLQSVSGSLREVAEMEGITEWQYFWKITLPMISPTIILNIIYTIIDTFTDTTNVLMRSIYTSLNSMQFANASAMAWVFFVIILVIIGLVYLILGKRIFYMNG